MKPNIALLIAALLIAGPALAQTDMTAPIAPIAAAPAPVATPVPSNNNSSQPIEITAKKSVEWLRNDKKYVAREEVVITQGDVTITSDLATADYRETPTASMQIWQLTAENNVTIQNADNVASGDKAVYDIDTAIATLTGSNLKLTSPDQIVTATEKMEYYTNSNQAKAIGNAKVVRGQDTLSANSITATFKDKDAAKPATTSTSPLGGGNLDRLEADGNVVIVTPTETLKGNRGIYRADTNIAEITGKVRIERDKNVIEGDRAEVNLTTNVSKMFGSETSGGRVRGVFFPGSDKKTDAKSPVPAPASPATVTP